MPEFALPLPFQIDHVIAEQHGGLAITGNLAFACPHCNRHKGPNIAGLDPQSGDLVRLFHPREDVWAHHFEFAGPLLSGKTAIGRTTIRVLAINAEDLLLLRVELLEENNW
jgi:hypothetical protein